MCPDPSPKLPRAPLVFTLVQSRFDPYLNMGRHVPQIQEALRAHGFTRFAEEQRQQVVFGREIETQQATTWTFVTKDRREAAILSRDFIVFQTSQYDVFESFLERFHQVIDAVKGSVDIDTTEQLGLRYVNLIRSTDRMEPCDFLRESLRGYSEDALEATSVLQQFMLRASTAQGHLRIHSFEGKGSRFLPPDLDASQLAFDIDVDTLEEERKFQVVDFDHIFRGEMPFEWPPIDERLRALHDQIERVFQLTFTPEAVAYWSGESSP